MADTLNNTALHQFVMQLMADNAARAQATPSNGTPTPAPTNPYQAPVNIPYNNAAIVQNFDTPDDSPGIVSRALDIISRPMYAVSNVIKDTIDPNPGTQNPAESFWAGLSGVDKTTGWDVMDKMDDVYFDTQDVPDWVKAVGGFALTVGADPLSYVPMGWALKPFTAATKAIKGSEKLAEARKVPLEATDTTKIKEAENAARGIDEKNLATTMKNSAIKEYGTGSGYVPTTKAVNSTTEGGKFGTDPNIARRLLMDDEIRNVVDQGGTFAPINEAPRIKEETVPFNDVFKQQVFAHQTTDAAELASKTAGKNGKPLYGNAKTQFKRKQVIEANTAEKDRLAAEGSYPVIKTPTSEYHMHWVDSLKVLGPEADKFHFGGPGETVPPSSLMAGTGATLDAMQKGLGPTESVASIRDSILKGHNVRTPSQKPTPTQAQALAESLYNKRDALYGKLIENETAYGLRDQVQGVKIGRGVSDIVNAKLNNPAVGLADNLKNVASIDTQVANAAAKHGTSPGGTITAMEEARRALDPTIPASDVRNSRIILHNARVLNKGGGVTAEMERKIAEESQLAAKEWLDAQPAPLRDFANTTEAKVEGKLQRTMRPLVSRFAAGLGHEALQKSYRNVIGGQEVINSSVNKMLNKIKRKYSSDEVQGAWTASKLGEDSEKLAESSVKDLHQQFKPALEGVLSLSNEPRNIIAGSAFFKDGITPQGANSLMKEMGIKHEFDTTGMQLDAAGMPVKEGDLVKLINQWKEWEIDNPLDFISKLRAAATNGAARKAMARQFAEDFGHPPNTPGMYRLREAKSDEEGMNLFIDHSKAYPPEAIRLMKSFDDTFMKKTSFIGEHGGVAALANNVIDPFLQIWKPSVTIARPGYHTRNAVGDYLMNVLAGVYSPKHYLNAVRIQKAIGRFDGDPKALAEYLSTTNMKYDIDPTHSMFSVHLADGKTAPLSAATAGQLAAQHGLLATYKHAEDLISKEAFADKGMLSKVTHALTENPYMNFMGNVSEVTGHHFRLAQYSKLMSDAKFTSKFKTLDEASQAAVTEVQKYHPDVAGLSKFEAKYMRRIIPFYSWFRQTMPIIMSHMLTNPARVQAPLRAGYAGQIALGMDPKSIEDPFPTDKSYPSFVTSHLLGPVQFGDSQKYAYSIGSPVEALADIFNPDISAAGHNGNPLPNIIGMGNPLIRALYELPTQQKAGTNSRVGDTGEYIDQMIPFVNQFSNATGLDVAGSLGNLITGDGPLLDPKRPIAQGDQAYFWNTGMLNFLAGPSVQNIDRPSFNRSRIKEQ